MGNRIVSGLVSMILVLYLAAYAQAGSVWAKRNRNMTDFYADDVARRIGDLLTIKITEDSKVDNKAKRDLKKETDRSTVFNGEIGGFVDLGRFGLSAKSANELKSKADYKDERSFVDSVSVVVVDLLPNGNLVVMGTRSRNIAGDKQVIEVSGIVRPSDIAFDNSVESIKVADFRIVTRNTGIAAPYTKQAWLGRILDLLWPL
ncbi:MAG: flagellar basal body L-ring protein FlgH [Planctomycetota bacterium]|jgi:flagellar L-ring protein precursor FlgH